MTNCVFSLWVIWTCVCPDVSFLPCRCFVHCENFFWNISLDPLVFCALCRPRVVCFLCHLARCDFSAFLRHVVCAFFALLSSLHLCPSRLFLFFCHCHAVQQCNKSLVSTNSQFRSREESTTNDRHVDRKHKIKYPGTTKCRIQVLFASAITVVTSIRRQYKCKNHCFLCTVSLAVCSDSDSFLFLLLLFFPPFSPALSVIVGMTCLRWYTKCFCADKSSTSRCSIRLEFLLCSVGLEPTAEMLGVCLASKQALFMSTTRIQGLLNTSAKKKKMRNSPEDGVASWVSGAQMCSNLPSNECCWGSGWEWRKGGGARAHEVHPCPDLHNVQDIAQALKLACACT